MQYSKFEDTTVKQPLYLSKKFVKLTIKNNVVRNLKLNHTVIVLEFQMFVCVTIDLLHFHGKIVDNFDYCGHSCVSVGHVMATQSMLYWHTRENTAHFQWS